MSLSEREQAYLKALERELQQSDPQLTEQFHKPPPGNITHHLPKAGLAGLLVFLFFTFFAGVTAGVIWAFLAIGGTVWYLESRATRRQSGHSK